MTPLVLFASTDHLISRLIEEGELVCLFNGNRITKVKSTRYHFINIDTYKRHLKMVKDNFIICNIINLHKLYLLRTKLDDSLIDFNIPFILTE